MQARSPVNCRKISDFQRSWRIRVKHVAIWREQMGMTPTQTAATWFKDGWI
jgi:hypothetical protein